MAGGSERASLLEDGRREYAGHTDTRRFSGFSLSRAHLEDHGLAPSPTTSHSSFRSSGRLPHDEPHTSYQSISAILPPDPRRVRRHAHAYRDSMSSSAPWASPLNNKALLRTETGATEASTAQAPTLVERIMDKVMPSRKGKRQPHRPYDEDNGWAGVEDEMEMGKRDLTTRELVALTASMGGAQLVWVVQTVYRTHYFTSLGPGRLLASLVWLAGPLAGLVVQPIIGAVSDASTSSFGRRRPYMLTSSLIIVVVLFILAYADVIASLLTSNSDGGDWDPARKDHLRFHTIGIAVLAFLCLDLALNTLQACARALVLDVPPYGQQQIANAWMARMIFLANALGYGACLVAFTYEAFLLRKACIVTCLALLGTLAMTLLTITEKPFVEVTAEPRPRSWVKTLSHIWRATANLPRSIQACCRVQALSWLGWSALMSYAPLWLQAVSKRSTSLAPPDVTHSECRALLFYSVVALFVAATLPWLTVQTATDHGLAGTLHRLRTALWRWQQSEMNPLTLRNLWTGSNILLGLVLISSLLVTNEATAVILFAFIGISGALSTWIPFALIGEFTRMEESGTTSVEPIFDVRRGEDPDSSSVPTRPSYQDVRSAFSEDIESPKFGAGVTLGVANLYIVAPQLVMAVVGSLIFRVAVTIPEEGSGDTRLAASIISLGGLMSLAAALQTRWLPERR